MDIDHKLLEKYWSGRCTPEEKLTVKAWMEKGCSHEQYELRSKRSEQEIKEELWERIANNSDNNLISNSQQPGTKGSYWAKVAAVLSLFIGAAWLLMFYPVEKEYKNQTPAYTIVTVPDGKRASLDLPDGSRVTLNAGSKLSYPKQFEADSRQVKLDGEGFFEVKKDHKRPFYVKANQSTVQVLGTRFNVKSVKGHVESVTVEEGKVNVKNNSNTESVLLTANMQAAIQQENITKISVDANRAIAWKRGELLLDNISLSQAVPEIERWYGIKITIKDQKLAQKRIKASFTNANSNEVMHDLATILNTTYTIKNKEASFGNK